MPYGLSFSWRRKPNNRHVTSKRISGRVAARGQNVVRKIKGLRNVRSDASEYLQTGRHIATNHRGLDPTRDSIPCRTDRCLRAHQPETEWRVSDMELELRRERSSVSRLPRLRLLAGARLTPAILGYRPSGSFTVQIGCPADSDDEGSILISKLSKQEKQPLGAFSLDW